MERSAAGSASRVEVDGESMVLSPDQVRVRYHVAEGRNAFVTGPGGTGKSLLIRVIAADMAHRKRKFAVTATTGAAAVQLQCGAQTVHAFLRCGLCDGPIETILAGVRKRARFRGNPFRTLDALILDEVSMLDGDFLDRMDLILREYRRDQSPFGGLQLIFFGDFYQLPPIREDCFAFKAKVWPSIFRQQDIIRLMTIHRQKDQEYAEILSRARKGEVRDDDIADLNTRIENAPDGVPRLFCRRRNVEMLNSRRLRELEGESVMFGLCKKFTAAAGSPKWVSQKLSRETDSLARSVPVHGQVLELRVGALVMSTTKLSSSIVNGSVGVVTGFAVADGTEEVASDRHFFVPGDRYPIVQFDGSRVSTMVPMCRWRRETSGVGRCTVEGMPLILAWAITIHKAQGATMEQACVDLGGVFASGQAYVALSRIKSMGGLYLEGPVTKDMFVSNSAVDQFFAAREAPKKTPAPRFA